MQAWGAPGEAWGREFFRLVIHRGSSGLSLEKEDTFVQSQKQGIPGVAPGLKGLGWGLPRV
jgi:hypothetical protein